MKKHFRSRTVLNIQVLTTYPVLHLYLFTNIFFLFLPLYTFLSSLLAVCDRLNQATDLLKAL